MKAYKAQDIRNVCILGHGGSGKTSLTEAMLYIGQGSDRLGKVADGNTVSDFDSEEIKRGISIYTTVEPVEWKNKKINVLDAPGFFDFEGQMKEAVRVAGSAIITVSAKSGVKVGTELAWKFAEERKIPKILFVTKMDDDKANWKNVLDGLHATFGSSIAPFYVPMLENEKFVGYINVIKMQARKFVDGKIEDIPVPDDMLDVALPARQMILESIAETSEELMEKYFGGEEFTEEEIQTALKAGIANLEITPVLCGSAFVTQSIRKLLDAVNDYLPAPNETAVEFARYADIEDDLVEVHYREERPVSALVFKTIADPFVGKLSYVKVFSGVLKNDMSVYNPRTGTTEKISKLYYMKGKKQEETSEVVAGDICAIPKLNETKTGDTLCDPLRKIIIDPIIYPEPCLTMAIMPKEKGDEEKISQGISKIREEDKTIRFETNTETKETLISGLGDTHLDVIVNKLMDKFKVAVTLKAPKIAYREAIKKKVEVEGKHKKQSGGHGQYGHVKIAFEPAECDELIFEEKIFGGSVPKNYFPAVEKGLRESCTSGVLAGFPVVNLKATLLDGSYHPVDSSEMAFKMAANLAFKSGLAQASPVLLEPVNSVEVTIPENYMGDVIGDINKRRGRVMGMLPLGSGMQKVLAEVPAAEMAGYATDLRSMTQARGRFTQNFERYEEAPPNVVEKVIAEHKKDNDE
jgi:elongation factor G